MYQAKEEKELLQSSKIWLQQPKAKELLQEEDLKDLRRVINFADWRYYVQDDPLLADQEYDFLFRLLKEVEELHPDWITPDSPSQRIAQGLSEQATTLPHLVPMLSLENSYNPDDLREWQRRCQQLLPNQALVYTVEPKYDGAGISLYYEGDLLQRGVTRGDGIQGELITNNIKQIKSIPLSAPFAKEGVEAIEIRGEVVFPKKDFEAYNARREKEGLVPLANPRNAASGTLRMLDPGQIADRRLHAVLYHVSYLQADESRLSPEIFKHHYSLLEWLYRCGFSTPAEDMKIFDSIEGVIDYCLAFEEKRDELPFEIDGMVIKVNSLQQQEQLGQTSHHPRWAMAYKFKARQATSRLLKVAFQVGRTGTITPVAKIEPVNIGGAMVASVSLFNEEVVAEKDLMLGDQVLVERAGDVIPYIVKSFPDLRQGNERPIVFPSHCPECGEHLFKSEGEVAWRCVNIVCPAQMIEHLIHFASKDAMDIRNLGEANVKRFYDLGWLREIPDIYRLKREAIEQLPKMGVKSADNLMKAIEESKQQSLHRLIFGLGIRYVGETTAKTLAASIEHLLDLSSKSVEELGLLEDVGEKIANSIYDFFHLPENIALIQDLAGLGVNMQRTKAEERNLVGGFSGKTFLFTGALSHFKRSEAKELVEARGGKLLSGVSSKLNYLVVGVEAGSKLEKAKKIGTITIWSEEQFLEQLKAIDE